MCDSEDCAFESDFGCFAGDEGFFAYKGRRHVDGNLVGVVHYDVTATTECLSIRIPNDFLQVGAALADVAGGG